MCVCVCVCVYVCACVRVWGREGFRVYKSNSLEFNMIQTSYLKEFVL